MIIRIIIRIGIVFDVKKEYIPNADWSQGCMVQRWWVASTLTTAPSLLPEELFFFLFFDLRA